MESIERNGLYDQIIIISGKKMKYLFNLLSSYCAAILYTADFNYLIRWVIVTYVLLDISVVNSHATSVYECELLAVTWHYLPSVRLDNARSVIRP